MNKTKLTADSDENYVLDLCDRILGITSSRQHNFDFQLDGYYEDYKIGITYCKKVEHRQLKLFCQTKHTTHRNLFHRL